MAYARRTYQKPKPVTFPTPRATVKRTPSPMQQAILDFISTTSHNLIIDAKAGTGKSATLEMICALPNVARANVVLLAFNKAIATELKERGLPGSTFHALGFASVGRTLSALNGGQRAQVDANKCGRIFDDNYPPTLVTVRSATLRIVSLLKNSAMLPQHTTLDTVRDIISHFDIEWDDDSVSDQDIAIMARNILTLSNNVLNVVDFDDMLYLVVVHNVTLTKYDFVLVDEAQDTNEMQREILRRSLAPSGRLIAVGDPHQAIYGFRGASHDSMQLIANEFNCTTLPLSVSYRCPSSVIELAQEIVPNIMARDNAPHGTIEYPRTWQLAQFAPDDLLVCRNTAPLVTIAYRMLAARRPCKILGREIGRALVSLITRVAGKRATLNELPDKILAYRDKEVAIAYSRKQETKAQAVADRCDSILALLDTMTEEDRSRGIAGLTQIIESMFSDNGPRVTTLCTVHKSKGLEAKRVFIVDYHLMPSKYARQEWQIVQEHNLRYVAITRSLDTLVFLDSTTVQE